MDSHTKSDSHHKQQLAEKKTKYRNQVKTFVKTFPPDVIEKKSQKITETLLSLPKFRSSRSIGIYYALPHEYQTSSIILSSLQSGKHVFLPRVTNTSTSTMEMYEIFNEYDYNNGCDKTFYSMLEPNPIFSQDVIEKSLQPLLQQRPNEFRYLLTNNNNDDITNNNFNTNQQQFDMNTNPQLESNITIPLTSITTIRPDLLLEIECISKLDLLLCPLVVCDLERNRVGYGAGYYDRYIKRVQTKRESLGLSPVPVIGLALPEQLIVDDLLPFDEYDVKLDAIIVGDRIIGDV